MVFGDAGAICGAILIDLVVSTGMCLRDKEARRMAAREAKRSQETAFHKPGSAGTSL
jgi:cytochrome c biogenesis protein ResB